MEILSICLTKIPKDRIKIGKDGHKYVSLIVSKRQEPDQYRNDLAVSISKTEQERKERVKTIYVGSGKTYSLIPVDPAQSVNDMPQATNFDDLPY